MSGKEMFHCLGGLRRSVTSQEVATPIGREEDVARELQFRQQGESGLNVSHRLKVTQGVIKVVEQGESPGLDTAILRIGKRGEEGITLTDRGSDGTGYEVKLTTAVRVGETAALLLHDGISLLR